MRNVTAISETKYRKAEEVNLTGEERRRRIKKLFLIFINLIFLMWCEVFVKIFNLFRPSKPENVAGQLCLITGAANGLGRCIAMRLAEEGCNIAIADVVSSAHTVKEIIRKYKVKCQGFVCDVSDNKSVIGLKQRVEEAMGSVNILVNNAGLLFMSPLLNCRVEDIDKCVAVNLSAHFKVIIRNYEC